MQCPSGAFQLSVFPCDGTHAKRTITSSGCPNHYAVCTGKGFGVCGGIGAEGTDTEATDQGKELEVPAEPVLATSTSDQRCALGPIAIAINGVSIYSGAVDQQCAQLDVTDQSSEWTSFDYCAGHAQNTGDYHYHFPPSCLLAQLGDLADGHSPQIGWAVRAPRPPPRPLTLTCLMCLMCPPHTLAPATHPLPRCSRPAHRAAVAPRLSRSTTDSQSTAPRARAAWP